MFFKKIYVQNAHFWLACYAKRNKQTQCKQKKLKCVKCVYKITVLARGNQAKAQSQYLGHRQINHN